MDITSEIRKNNRDPGTVALKALVVPQLGPSVMTELFVGSTGKLSIPIDAAKAVRRTAGASVAISCELDAGSIATLKARVAQDGTVEVIPGTSAEVKKATLRKADTQQNPTNVVGQPTKPAGLWKPCLNEGGFVGSNGLLNSSAALPRTGDDGSEHWDRASAFEVDLTAGRSDVHPVIAKACDMIIRRSRGSK